MIATTGMTGRELFAIADKPRNLYQVGSMGCAAPMGLGVALNVEGPVVVLDGDGAALMKMGALATIGAYRPENLIHVVLDNGTYDSTGGQPTVSPSVDSPPSPAPWDTAAGSPATAWTACNAPWPRRSKRPDPILSICGCGRDRWPASGGRR